MTTIRSARWWALAAMTLGVLAVGLDLTVLSIALPKLAYAFHATEAELQWFTSSYALALTAAILPAGLLADSYGRKRGLLVSLGLFGLGSVFCACAPSAGVFIIARTLLGLAGAGVITLVLSALPALFSEAERPKAVGIWAAANFLAMPVGPILGGWILTHHWWGWVFLMNVPVALIGLLAIFLLMPESPSVIRKGADGFGIVASSLGLVGVTYGIIQSGEYGWNDGRALLYLTSGLLVLIIFVFWEQAVRKRGKQPLIDLDLFRSRAFVSGVLLMTIGTIPMAGLLFTTPQYFQAVHGMTAEQAGVRLLPLIAGMIIGAVPADKLVGRIGAKVTLAVGFAVLAVGNWMAAGTSSVASSGFIVTWMVVIGIGSGVVMSTAVSAALMELSDERAGAGTALMQAVKNLGLPFGTAILGSVLDHVYQSQVSVTGLSSAVAGTVKQSVYSGSEIARGLGRSSLLHSVDSSFTHGMDASFLVAVAFAAAGGLIALVLMPHRRVERTHGSERMEL